MNNMKKLFFVFAALFYSFVYAEEAQAFDFSPVTEENISLVLYDIEAHKNVISINADKPFLYASNLKLLTSAVALKHLGGGFKFLTKFSFDSESGTLYIKAGGDPEMVVEKLWLLASDLKMRGVKGIKKVVVDDFLYGKNSALTAKVRPSPFRQSSRSKRQRRQRISCFHIASQPKLQRDCDIHQSA